MQIIRFRRSQPAGRNRFVFFSVRRLSGKRESLSRQPERLCPAARRKAPSRRRAGRFHAVPNGSGAAFFRGQGGRAQGVFANPSIVHTVRRMYSPASDRAACYFTTSKNACLQGRFCEPVNAVRRTYVREGRTAFCPAPAGPHCYYNTSGALCHHLKLFFCKNLCARPMGNFTKTTLHKIICMLQSNR